MAHRSVPRQRLQRRGGPLAPCLVVALLMPLCAGCWLDHFHHRETTDLSRATANYYQDAVANTSAPYATGIELEIPQDPPPLTNRNPEAEVKWMMTLREAIEIALRNSKIVRQLRGDAATAVATAYDPAIAETRIQQELAKFDTSLVMGLFWGKDNTQLNSNVAPSGGTVGTTPGDPFIFRQDTFGGIAGRNTGMPGAGDLLSLRKTLATGGEITMGFNTDYSLSNVPPNSRAFRAAYDTRFFTSFRQPILQGASVEVNRAPIVIVRLEADRSVWEFRTAISQLVRDVEAKYWELVISEAQLQALERAIELNLEVVRNLELKLIAGTGTEVDLKHAQVQLTTLLRERLNYLTGGGLFSPRRQSRIAEPILVVEQQLRGLLGLPPADGRRIVPAEEPLVAPVTLDWYNAVIDAFTYNPDIQGLKLRVAARREALKIAADGLKPRLDLIVRAEMTGLGAQFDDSIREVNHGGFDNWTYGIQFQQDLGYRRAAAIMQQRHLELDQERELLRDKGREVQQSLALNYQQIQARFDSWVKSFEALQLTEEEVELSKLLYDDGKLPLDRWLEVVRGYTDTVTEEISDRSAFQIALANLEVTKGTIFQYNNIHLHEDAWPLAAYPQAARQEEDRARAIEWYHGQSKIVPEPDRIPVYNCPNPADKAVPQAPSPYDQAPVGLEDPGEVPLDLSARDRHRSSNRSLDLVLPSGTGTTPGSPRTTVVAKSVNP